MKVLIIGATGTIGRELVAQSLVRGFEVTAVVRNPAKLDMEHPRLKVTKGDVLQPQSLAPAMEGQDAVLLALGAGAKGNIRSQGTRNVAQVMQNKGIKRLICLSSLGVGESRSNLNFFWKYVMFGMLLRKAYADHMEQENFVRNSNLNWTLVRPGAFTDGPVTANYRHGFGADARNLKLKISRADVAHFMLNQLSHNRYVRKAPGLTY